MKAERTTSGLEAVRGYVSKRIRTPRWKWWVREPLDGFLVELDGGGQGYVPLQHIDLGWVRDPTPYLGQTFCFLSLPAWADDRRVLSRRCYLEAEREPQRRHVEAALSVGAVFEATVRNVTDYGLFVDLGGQMASVRQIDNPRR